MDANTLSSGGRILTRDTRLELMKLGSEMLLSRGYNGFSYQDLSVKLNIRKASIHHHFTSKEALGVAIIEQSRQAFEDFTARVDGQYSNDVQCIEAYINIFTGLALQGDKVCLSGVLCVEHETVPESLRQSLQNFQKSQREWLRRKIAQGRRSGAVKKQGTIEGQVDFILATLQGALQINRAFTEKAIFKPVIEQLKAAIFT